MNTIITKVLGRLVLVIGLSGIVLVASYAKDIEPGITFATQGIDLKIDSRAFYNGLPFATSTWKLKDLVPSSDHFFNFQDIKPGDFGQTTISMHVKKADAWLCLDFENLTGNESGRNEPESLVDTSGNGQGELASAMEFFAWIDDGDNKFEKKEKPVFGNVSSTQSANLVLKDKTYSLGDTQSGNSCKVNETRYIGIYWCAGDLTVDVANAKLSCSGVGLGNSIQTDSMSVDVSIRALPAKENPKFICKDTRPYKLPKHDDHYDSHNRR